MITLFVFLATAVAMNTISYNNVGYIPGYGAFQGIIPGWLVAISILLVSFALLFDISQSPKLQRFQGELFFGLSFRVFLIALDIYGRDIIHLPNSGADSSMYYRNAAVFASTNVLKGGGLFSKVMGYIFKLTGVSQFYGQFVIALFSIVAIIMLINIFDEIIDDNNYDLKRKIVLVVALLPNFAIISSIFLRESLISMCIACSVYFIVRWIRGYSFVNLIFAFALALLASAFHSGTIAVVMAYIVFIFMFDRQNNRISVSIKNIPLVVGLMGMVFYLYLNYGDVLFNKMLNMSSLEAVANTNLEGGSSYAAYVGDSSTPLRMIVFSVPRFVYFLFSPFPWQWRGIADIIAFVFSSLFYLLAFIQGIKSIKYSNADDKKYAILFFSIALCTAFVFSWGTSNTGTATRHREKMVIIYAVMYALGLENKRDNFECNE